MLVLAFILRAARPNTTRANIHTMLVGVRRARSQLVARQVTVYHHVIFPSNQIKQSQHKKEIEKFLAAAFAP